MSEKGLTEYSLFEQPVLFVDCQTTGATPGSAHLLEVGWVVGSAALEPAPPVVTRLVALPDDEILPNRIQKITGISAEDMAQAVAAPQVCAELLTLINEHRLRYAVAHWAQFERTFLSHYFAQNTDDKMLPLDFVCTCQIAKKLFPDLPSRAIRAVAGYFGLSIEEMKRAGGHVETTYFIWQKLVPELDALGLKNLADLFEWLKAPVKKPAVGASRLRLERLTRLELPDQPGVYRMLNSNGKILYVGKATSLKSRVNSYFTGRKGKDSKTKELISQVFDLDVSPLATPFEAALLENDLIKEHDPPYNRALKKRGRALVYFNREFSSAADKPDDEHTLGPFPRGSTIEPLLLLVSGLQTGTFDPGLFWGLLDQEQTDRAVRLFFAEENIDIESPGVALPTVRSLLALGLRNYRQYLLSTLATQASARSLSLTYFIGPAAEKIDDEIDAELLDGAVEAEGESEPEDADEEAEELSDEELAQMVRSLVTGSARAYALARTLMRLLDITIAFEEKKRRRKLVFQRGRLTRSEDLGQPVIAEGQAHYAPMIVRPGINSREAVDLVTYDRMRILLAEIRRLHGRGHWISLMPADLVIS
ncbi:MAG: GIY-YIG nuclease family protein [Cyanobacteria bacterium SZAS LIN-2]|nr:GIY-YIG nuclease family protein [Cyanobacteria bacterium SZAS LIN-2]